MIIRLLASGLAVSFFPLPSSFSPYAVLPFIWLSVPRQQQIHRGRYVVSTSLPFVLELETCSYPEKIFVAADALHLDGFLFPPGIESLFTHNGDQQYTRKV